MKLTSKKETNTLIILNNKLIIIKAIFMLSITDIRKLLQKLTIIIRMLEMNKNIFKLF